MMDMDSAIQEFLAEIKAKGHSRHTVEAYQRSLELFSSFCKKNGIDYRNVNGKETRAFRNRLVSRTIKNNGNPKATTVNLALSALKSFYDYLVGEDEVRANPVIPRLVRVKEERQQPRFLSDGDQAKILDWLNGNVPGHITMAFKVMFATGLRVSEIADLTGNDIFIYDNGVFLKVRQGKGQKERIVPVTDAEVARELMAMRDKKGNNSLFKVGVITLKGYARRARIETGVDFSCHKARHTLATRLLNHGQGLDVIQELLGHESIDTTRRYARTMPEKVRALAAKI